jgi:hypothetical protein
MKLRIIYDKYEERFFLQEKGLFFWHKCYRWDYGIPNGDGKRGFTTLESAEQYAVTYRERETAWRMKKKGRNARDRISVIISNA